MQMTGVNPTPTAFMSSSVFKELPVDTDTTVMTRLFYNLKTIQAQQATGELVITIENQSSFRWCIYFYLGRIVWATGGNHRLRRWFRILKQHCPDLLDEFWSLRMTETMASPILGDNEYWEVKILSEAFHADDINLAQTKAIIHSYVQEVFFELFAHPKLKTTWTSLKELPQQFVWLDVSQVVKQSSDLCQQWRQAVSSYLNDLPDGFSPDFAATIQQQDILKSRVSPVAYQVLSRLLNGKNTLWDLALKMQKPLVPVVVSLLPFIRDDIIRLEEIPDLVVPLSTAKPQPTSKIQTPHPIVPMHKGLIACIDDSPVIGQELEAILKPLGYEVLSILDPLQGVGALLKHKPKLIFLDLVMPNTNGYELCSFLRKTAAFRDLPIVMLTGHDGIVDRLRAKVAGSTDFLSKPPDAARVLQVIQKYLGDGIPDVEQVSPPPRTSSAFSI